MISTRKYLAFSIGISLLLHFVLFNVASRLPAFNALPAKKQLPKEKKSPVRLSKINLKKLTQKPELKFDVSIKETPSKIADTFKNQGLTQAKTSELKPKEYTQKPAELLGNAPDLKAKGLSQELPPNVYHIKTAPAQKLDKTGVNLTKNFENVEIKKPGVGNPLTSPGQNGNSGSPQLGMKRTFPKIRPPELEFKSKTPKINGRDLSAPKVEPYQKKKTDEKPGEMEFFLNIRPFVYIDNDDEIGYFRLDLSPNNRASGLEAIKKDVFFLVDSSKSISVSQLAQFKKGLTDGLQSLGAEDRFNVIDFTTKAVPCFPTITPNSLSAIAKATDFIGGMRSYGKTDVYTSIKPYITETVRDNNRPILVFVMTDGVSTVSENMENSQLIHKITQENKEKISIFGYSCGDNINSFLLDFMTYRNRGDSMIINGLQGASGNLTRYINGRANIIVTDLVYRYMGNNQGDLFPKSLPHLYKERTLSIFGTFDLNEEENIIQMLGQSSSGPRQLIYKFKYDDAERAGKDLARSWAAQKIFHLIGQLTDKKDPEVVTEIRRLQQKFEVYIPYELPK